MGSGWLLSYSCSFPPSLASETTGPFKAQEFVLCRGRRGSGPGEGSQPVQLWVSGCFLQTGLWSLNILSQESYSFLPALSVQKYTFPF